MNGPALAAGRVPGRAAVRNRPLVPPLVSGTG